MLTQPSRPSHPALDLAVIAGGVAAFTLLALCLLWPMLGKPYVYDEVSFAQMAEAIAATGVPFTNVGFMIDRGFLNNQSQFGLWHPPLYLYTLGAVFAAFGSSEVNARLLGVACMAVTALLTALAVRQGLPDNPQRNGFAVWAAAIYIVNPLTLQSALVLDIDGTVLTVVVMALCLAYLVLSDRGPLGIGLVALVFAASLSAKMTTPFFVLGAIVARRTLQGRLPLGLAEAAAIGGIGSVVWIAVWWLACAALKMPFLMPFEVLGLEFQDAASHGVRSLRTFDALASAAQPAIRWLGPFLPLLLVAATAVRAMDHLMAGVAALPRLAARLFPAARRTAAEPPAAGRAAPGSALDLFIVLSWIVLAIYLIKTAAEFPKYHIAAVPPLSAAAALFAARAFSSLRVGDWIGHPLAAVVLGVYFFAEVGERFIPTWDYAFLGPTLGVPTAIICGAAAVGLLLRGRLLAQIALLPAVASIAWTGPVLLGQAASPYSTNYFYGSGGAYEIAQATKAVLGPDEFYLASKDVAYYLPHHNYVDQDSFWWLLNVDRQRFDGTWFGRPIRVIVIFGREPTIREQFYAELIPRYEVREVIGDFALLVRRPTGAR